MKNKIISFEPYKALKSILEVTSSHVGDQFLEKVCYQLKELFNADLVFIAEALDYPVKNVSIKHTTSLKYAHCYPVKDTPCELVFEKGITNIDSGVNRKFSAEKDTDFESFYGIPLYDEQNECIGHIAIMSDFPRELPNEVEDIAKIFAHRIEAEILRIKLEKENSLINEKLLEQSITDSLTNVYNRRFFVKKCTEVFAQFKRKVIENCSIIFLDIDDFKKINDTYGHTMGDYVLKEVCKVFLHTLRENIDFLARVGGEEFGIISINSNIEDSEYFAKRLVENINKRFEKETYSITFSIGIAVFNLNDENWEKTYNLADERMYKIKATGKNAILSQ